VIGLQQFEGLRAQLVRIRDHRDLLHSWAFAVETSVVDLGSAFSGKMTVAGFQT
jgi:hypothetical protein